MVEETRADTFLRQAPFIEERQKRLLDYAEGVSETVLDLPTQEVADLDPLTLAAMQTGRGIGQYQDLLNTARGTLGTGVGTLRDLGAGVGQKFTAGAGAAADAIRSLQQRGLAAPIQSFDLARQALTGAGGAYAPTSGYTAEGFQRGPGYEAEGFQRGPGYEAGRYGTADLGPQAYAAQAFDPGSVASYFNPYEDAAVQQALRDISRQGEIAQNQLSAQAVGAGAFGGSRQGLQSAELARNVLEQQGRTAAGMRQAGFQNAMQQAQGAFADQQRRAQAQAQFGTQAGQQAFEDAQRRAQAEAQFGTTIGSQAFADLQRRAQAEAQFGTTIGSQAFADYQRRAQAEAQFGTQVGQQAYEDAQRRSLAMGQGLGTLGGQQAGMSAQYAQTMGGLGSTLAGIGAGQSQEAVRQGVGIGSLGTSQANIAGAGQNMLGQQAQLQSQLGALGQTQQQRINDAAYQATLRQKYEPMQRYSWMSDILKPTIGSATSTLATTTAPSPSGLSQLIGGGVVALGLNKAIGGNPLGGLFGRAA
jgi:hypothetical protein